MVKKVSINLKIFSATLTLLAMVLALCAFIVTLPAYAAADTSWYSGHESDSYYEISTADELAGLEYLVNTGSITFENKTIKLMANIELKNSSYSSSWTAIGSLLHPFKGTFDGNDKTISNIKVLAGSGELYGLFGYIEDGAVKNLNIFNINAELINKGSSSAGGIAARILNTEIINCSVSSSRITAHSNAGGIVGFLNSSAIENSKVFSSYISAQINAGGIAGSAADNNNKILNSLSTNNNIFAEAYTVIAGIKSVSGGLIGTAQNMQVIECQSVGNNILSQRYAGGIAGTAYNTTISGSYNTSTVRGKDGSSFEGVISPSGANGVPGIEGTSGVDGKPGEAGASGGAGGSAGGLVCMLDYASKIEDSFNAGQVFAGIGGVGGDGGDGGMGGPSEHGFGGGNGGSGGVGGNGGAGGSVGAIFVFYINNQEEPVSLYTRFENTYTKPGQARLRADSESSVNGGQFGVGGNGGGGGQGLPYGNSGNPGADGNMGDNGSIIKLPDEERTPKLLFNYNGGSVGTAEKSVDFNSAFETLPNPVKANSKFIGWNTQLDGMGIMVSSSTLFLSVDNIQLYAQYEALININIYIDESNSSSQLFDSDDFVLAKLNNPQRRDYAFDGWFINSGCTVALSQTATAQDLGNNAIIYAKWLREIKINFNITDGGSIINNEEPCELNNYNTYAPGQRYVIRVSGRPIGDLPTAAPAAVNSQNYFGGWYRDLSNTSTLVAATTIFNYGYFPLVNGEITLSSRWNTNAFLEYNLMGATGIDECSAAWDGGAEAYGGRGNASYGTQANPFTIANARQLRQMAIDINGSSGTVVNKDKYFILTNNIDLNDMSWDPIGSGATVSGVVSRFEGNFSGNGFYIKNLKVSRIFTSGSSGSRNFMGLFGAAYNARISQVGLESGQILLSITGSATIPTSRAYVGSVIGLSSGTTVIDQCYNNATVTVNINRTLTGIDFEAYVGGLVGLLENGNYESWPASQSGSTFRDSYNNADVTSNITYNSGKVYNFVGGIIGFVFKSTFINVFNTGNVDILTRQNNSATGSTIAFAGGICGEIQGGGNLTNSFNTGSVNATIYATGGDRRGEVGGVVAHLNNEGGAITINGCKNFGDINIAATGGSSAPGGGRDIGGIIGLIVGTPGQSVSGSKNYYKYNSAYRGICSYNNGSTKTSTSTNGSPGSTNGNHLRAGSVDLMAYSSTSAYGTGDFAFTQTSYFDNSTYFNDTNSNSAYKKWDFKNIWEFRLDRNDNLPLLKYMSYLTEYNNGVLTPNRKYVYDGERVGRLIKPVKTGFSFEGWWNVPVEFDPELGVLAYNKIAAVDGQNGFIKYVGKNPLSSSDTNSTIFRGVDNIQIYAAWLPDLDNITHQVILTGLAAANDTITAYKGYELRQLYTPQREGYTFLGWYDGSSNEYTKNTIYTLDSNLTLTARWQANSYIITLNPGLGYLSQLSFVAVFGETLQMLPVPYRFGYTFEGWIGPDGQPIGNGDSFEYIGKDIEFTAKWSDINSYDIIFDKNTSSVGITEVPSPALPSQSIAFDDKDNLRDINDIGYSLSGFDFVGWALTPKGSVVYKNGAPFKMDTEGNRTLFAVWRAQTYFVRMHTQGGKVENSRDLIKEGSANERIELPRPTKAGYTFKGWNTLASGNGEMITSRTIAIGSSHIDLYAIWEEKEFEISYDGNGGEIVPPNSAPASQFTQASLIPPIYLRNNTYDHDHYTFAGWTLEIYKDVAWDNIPAAYRFKEGTAFYINEITEIFAFAVLGEDYDRIILYAVWKPQEFVVNFNINAPSGSTTSGSMPGQIFYYEQTNNIKANGFIVYGYQFAGWNTLVNGNGTAYGAGAALTFPADTVTILYAQWQKINYVVEFRSVNQRYDITQSVIYGDDLEILSSFNPFSRLRYEFVGWSFERDSTLSDFNLLNGYYIKTIDINVILQYAPSGNTIVLYAAWQPRTYNLKVYLDDGVGNDRDYITISGVIYGKSTFYLDYNHLFEKAGGYDFIGLAFDGSDAQDSLIAPINGVITIGTSFFNNDMDETPKALVARYRAIPVYITGILNTSGLPQNSVTYKERTSVIADVIPFKSGLIFSMTLISGNISLDADFVTNGKFYITADNMSNIEFIISVIYTSNGQTASYEFIGDKAVVVNKRIITLISIDNDFVFSGAPQQVASSKYRLGNIAESDISFTSSITFDRTFLEAGSYVATVEPTNGWENYYTIDSTTCIFRFTMHKKELKIILKSIDNPESNIFEKAYFSENPTGYTTVFEGFEGADNATNLNIVVNYSTLCTQTSGVGRYTIYQSIPTLDNYERVYLNGYIDVVPVTVSNASVSLLTGAGGYVEGGKLYFDIDNIDFGDTPGNFDWDDFDIVWEYSKSPNGTWKKISGANESQLILTSYKLDMDVTGLYFRVRLVGKGNIDSSWEIYSTVSSNQKIAASPSSPPLPEIVIIVIGALGVFVLLMFIISCILGARSKKLVKRIELRKIS